MYSGAFHQATVDCLSRFSLIKNDHDRAVVDKFACGWYGGLSSPRSNFRDGLMLTQYVSLWLFWDDLVVGRDMSWGVEAVVAALTDERPPDTSDGVVLAWHDLCNRLRKLQTEGWQGRLAYDMEIWMRNAKVETLNADRYRATGELPPFETMLDIRTVSIGFYPTLYLIESAEGLDLPDDFYVDPHVVELTRLASRLISYGNDLGGFAKDHRDGWPNLVTGFKAETGSTTAQTFRALVDMHNAEVDAFDEVAKKLPSWGAEVDVQVAGWLQAIRYSVAGFTLWESTAQRYQQYKPVVDEGVLAAPLTFYE